MPVVARGPCLIAYYIRRVRWYGTGISGLRIACPVGPPDMAAMMTGPSSPVSAGYGGIS
ncbi:hypothetical protein NITHO_3430009 [Nitrolancea hollandica Lb]|uniref:Uncharacterized protein n=1 Tax=Nitrolancea hollandica Lb TaxID=1129897 RepID=I4EIF2_9BACT|nr:hypothetical protein NITHO_3430009 [Nitrolancea hollandica Lb]